jgi:hypothetical protein
MVDLPIVLINHEFKEHAFLSLDPGQGQLEAPLLMTLLVEVVLRGPPCEGTRNTHSLG